MKRVTHPERLLVVGGALVALALVLAFSVIPIALYYFVVDEAIPDTVNSVLNAMHWSSLVLGASGLIVFAVGIIRLLRSHSRRRRVDISR